MARYNVSERVGGRGYRLLRGFGSFKAAKLYALAQEKKGKVCMVSKAGYKIMEP